ncbi:MAG: polysulfide reductase NrfD [Saprospiraceae bacterium]|nr:polysulfide reductase NrfD [Saprospiraceae bacterium]
MRYGFIIDNRKCIGCHACTTACKAEHQVAVGVNRTWVKQVEKGTFPNTRRLFSVMRCNHCTDAPCVEICPVEALFFREDGIVDFNKDRCIGCKSCMQACPYDALYIDPDNHTAAKCNYCANRIDLGLEPACVNVCPEHAIISGDMDNPDSEIAQLLARQPVKVRKAEKGTRPNLFYIDADDASLVPAQTEKTDSYFWSSQSLGVGHYAKEAEKMAFSNGDVIDLLQKQGISTNGNGEVPKSIDLLMQSTKRIYDSPDKGILWGWEVSAYVWTKAISAGIFIAAFFAWLTASHEIESTASWMVIGIALVFLGLTGLLLIKDLDRPDRFLNVLLRPQWNSWLVRGGYAISVFGGLTTLLAVSIYFGWSGIQSLIMWVTALAAVIVAVYTAFLFAQAKGRDFWQSPTLAIHMLIHSIMAGAAVYLIVNMISSQSLAAEKLMVFILFLSLLINLVTITVEMITTHPTVDAKKAVHLILKGRYANKFWIGSIIVGNIIPLILLTFFDMNSAMAVMVSATVLIGIFVTEQIWVEAPQRISLS